VPLFLAGATSASGSGNASLSALSLNAWKLERWLARWGFCWPLTTRFFIWFKLFCALYNVACWKFPPSLILSPAYLPLTLFFDWQNNMTLRMHTSCTVHQITKGHPSPSANCGIENMHFDAGRAALLWFASLSSSTLAFVLVHVHLCLWCELSLRLVHLSSVCLWVCELSLRLDHLSTCSM